MKTSPTAATLRPVLFTGLFSLLLGSSEAATVFYSFDTEPDGSGSFTTDVTKSQGFASLPSEITASGNESSPAGGEASFTDYDDVVWTGSGGSSGAGHSLQWNPGATGNTFTLTLNTLDLEDLAIRMAVRSAESGSGVRPTGFSSLTYDTGSGPVAITGLPGFGSNNSFNEWTLDLASLDAIENQASVTFEWTLPSPIPNDTSVRVDNLVITAVPEFSSLGLAAFGALGLMRRRR